MPENTRVEIHPLCGPPSLGTVANERAGEFGYRVDKRSDVVVRQDNGTLRCVPRSWVMRAWGH